MQQVNLTENQVTALTSLRTLLAEGKTDTMTPKEINEAIWERVINPHKLDAKEVFAAVYLKLIGREQGPRLPGFIKEIGAKRVHDLLEV